MPLYPAIKKAVFPVAGLGTRFLPATKANPKEMLPVVDKPLIQYAVEEAIQAGITELIFVTSSSKRAIEDHFDTNFELETRLAQDEKDELLALVQNIVPKGVNCVYVRQAQALGLGHAVLCAKPVIGEAPFAVLLADDLIDAPEENCLTQMMRVYQKTGEGVLAVEPILPEQTDQYGVVAVNQPWAGKGAITHIVEKPKPNQAPSHLGVVGRYLLPPEIFTFLEALPQHARQEIQLTDAIAALLAHQAVIAYEFAGTRYDCGSKLGLMQASVAMALKHPEIQEGFKEYLKTMVNVEELNAEKK